jgi:hypothetical protein
MSTIKTNKVENSAGDVGIQFDPVTKRMELISQGFVLNFDGINIVPQDKTRVQYTFSASNQNFVVPTGITHIYAKLWGAGGAGGGPGWSTGSFGGGGGHTRGIVPVTPGETLSIRVPRGGFANPGATNAPWGGGSSTGGGDNQYAGGGGGYCGLFRGSTPLLIAGAGGGGGCQTGSYGHNNGGAGGGLTGRRGECGRNNVAFAGGGGTQSAGGAAGTGTSSTGNAGSSLQGGSVNGNVYGGGGGGGFFGGGSGSYGASDMGGGGGGSGFVASSVIMGGTYSGSGREPARVDDTDYPASTTSNWTSIGFGGVQTSNGGDGFLVIYY